MSQPHTLNTNLPLNLTIQTDSWDPEESTTYIYIQQFHTMYHILGVFGHFLLMTYAPHITNTHCLFYTHTALSVSVKYSLISMHQSIH